jgi:hypothetical protein
MFLSCNTAFFNVEGTYTRQGKASSYFEQKYNLIDTPIYADVRICKTEKIITVEKFKTNSKITFDTESINLHLKESLNKKFKNIIHYSKEKTFWFNNCRDLNKKKVLNSDISDISFSKHKGYEIKINFDVTYSTRKKADVDATIITTYEILDYDVHFMEYKLIFAMFNNQKLIYMDNNVTWESVDSKRGEKINYEVPQNIIDSLVTKSLAEYKKRLKT